MQKKHKIEGIYLVTDRNLCGKKTLLDVVRAAAEGGVNMIQLREKETPTREFMRYATELKEILHEFGVPLLINDRVDIALATGADGVHLGQNDIPWQFAREILGENAIIGISVENMDQLQKAQTFDVDYIAISAVFSTPTKMDTQNIWGIKGLKEGISASIRPVVAIGGINHDNAPEIFRAGADCIAVVSAICAADNPLKATEELYDCFRRIKG